MSSSFSLLIASTQVRLSVFKFMIHFVTFEITESQTQFKKSFSATMVVNTKYGFLAGRMRDNKEFLNREMDLKDVNSLPIIFQDLTVSEKKYS